MKKTPIPGATRLGGRAPMRRVGDQFSGLRRAIGWHRRKLAVLAAVVAILATISALRPAPTPAVSLVVAGRDLPGGLTLTAGDLRIVDFPVSAAPKRALTSEEQLLGRTLVAPMTAGSPVTELSVLSSQFAKARAGKVITAVSLMDSALASRLSVGDEVDLVTSPANEVNGKKGKPQVIVARLVTVPNSETGGGFGGSRSQTVVLVEVAQEAAAQLIQAAAAGPLTLVLR